MGLKESFDKPVHFAFDLPPGMMEELQERGMIDPLAHEMLRKLGEQQPSYEIRFDQEQHSIHVLVSLSMVQDLLDELVVCLYGDEEWDHDWETLRNAGWSETADG